MNYYNKVVNVIGCGYAGIECALFLSGHGVKVHMFDAGLSYSCNCKKCTGQERTFEEELLKEELKLLGSPLIKEEENLTKAGLENCIACELLTAGKELVKKDKNIQLFEACLSELNPKEINVIATGSHTDEKMFDFLMRKFGSMRCFNHMYKYPLVDGVREGELYSKGEEYYLPLSYDQYLTFVNTIIKVLNRLDISFNKFCPNTMEELACKGKDCLKNHAMMPVYLECKRPYAVLRLHKEAKGYRLEGLSSQLDRASQLEIIRSINGLEGAELIESGDVTDSVHLNSKYVVNEFNQAQKDKNIFFAGSLLGAEGVIDCIASGLYTAMNVNKYIKDLPMLTLPKSSLIGRHMERFSSSAKEGFGGLDILDLSNAGDRAKRSFESLEKFKEEYIYGKYV